MGTIRKTKTPFTAWLLSRRSPKEWGMRTMRMGERRYAMQARPVGKRRTIRATMMNRYTIRKYTVFRNLDHTAFQSIGARLAGARINNLARDSARELGPQDLSSARPFETAFGGCDALPRRRARRQCVAPSQRGRGPDPDAAAGAGDGEGARGACGRRCPPGRDPRERPPGRSPPRADRGGPRASARPPVPPPAIAGKRVRTPRTRDARDHHRDPGGRGSGRPRLPQTDETDRADDLHGDGSDAQARAGLAARSGPPRRLAAGRAVAPAPPDRGGPRDHGAPRGGPCRDRRRRWRHPRRAGRRHALGRRGGHRQGSRLRGPRAGTPS